jgi:hypothetical protein
VQYTSSDSSLRPKQALRRTLVKSRPALFVWNEFEIRMNLSPGFEAIIENPVSNYPAEESN